MHLRFFSTILLLLTFSVIGVAQDDLKASFEPAKYPVTRNDLFSIKTVNNTAQPIETKLLLEVKNTSDRVLFSWLAPSYTVQPGTQTVQIKEVPGMSLTADDINSAQGESQLAVFVTSTVVSQYGFSEKTAIYKFPAQSFDFSSQFSDKANTAASNTASVPTTAVKSEPIPAPATPRPTVNTTTTVPNQIPDYTPVSPPVTTTQQNNASTVVPEKMNVLYLGVDNPLKITGADSFTTVSCDQPGISIRPSGGAYFAIMVTIPGEYTLTISTAKGESQQVFRAKRIPDPIAYLGDKFGGDIGAGQFIEQLGVMTHLYNFDFDAKCQATNYTVWRIQTNGTRSSITNDGPRFSAETQQLINQAVPGDIYIFDGVRARCPGDVVQRPLPGMTFFIK